MSGRSGWGSYSLLYSPFNHVYLSVACAAYQCLGGVAGAAILCCILPLTMYIWALLVLPISVWEEWLGQLFSSASSLQPCIFERCLCCLYPVSGRSGWSCYSHQYPPFNNVYLSVACAAYTQCLGGVAGAAILISILPLTMYIWALLVLPIPSVWEGGWSSYSLLYSPFNPVYLSVACAAY